MMQKSREFPIPVASDIFYAGYCMYKTANSGKSLTTVSGTNETSLAREMSAAHMRILGLSTKIRSVETARKLQSTLLFALEELDIKNVPFDTAKLSGESEYLQAYLTGPVEEAGVDVAMRLGWLLGERPKNPFNSVEALEAGWRLVDKQLHAAL